MKYTHEDGTPFSKEEFLQKLKTDKEFNDEFGNKGIDQIYDLIKQLKENPDSRRLLVLAWNISDLPHQVLPPCHYGFQVYTRELSGEERWDLLEKKVGKELFDSWVSDIVPFGGGLSEYLQSYNIPKRAISLMWNQRSVDTPLGLPFNIASYALLLEILARIVNMVPDELIGNLGDTHIYVNQIDGIKEQLGTQLSLEERIDYWFHNHKPNRDVVDWFDTLSLSVKLEYLYDVKVPFKSREPYELPTLRINSEFWPTKSGECGVGEFTNDINALINQFQIDDFQLENYKSHPKINFPLSN